MAEDEDGKASLCDLDLLTGGIRRVIDLCWDASVPLAVRERDRGMADLKALG
jgi:hypothetical protein